MRTFLMIISSLALVLSMAGCSATCKESGCDEKAYKDGYCEYHYGIHQLEKAFSSLVN